MISGGKEVGKGNLADDGLDVEQGDPLVLTPDDELEEVVAQHLEHHADVGPVDPVDFEIVKELDRLLTLGVGFVALADAAEEFDLVQRRLCVVGRALDHLQCHKTLRPVARRKRTNEEGVMSSSIDLALQPGILHEVPAEPHCGEVTPAQLADDVVTVVEEIANLHRMISACRKA